MTFGILQRYVIGEVVRAFVMALTTMTAIFVLFTVMAVATDMGLSPRDILALIPYVIPSTLPYTVPVSMLFSVSVVYGRLASDNEIVAVKTAGLSAMSMIWPAIIMGTGLSALLLFLSQNAIPHANHNAKLTIFKNFEDTFYKFLKKEGELTRGEWLIAVRDVDVLSRTMYGATIKHKNKKDPNPNAMDMIIQAKRAVMKFDLERDVAHVYLDGSEITVVGKNDDVVLINDREFEMPIPDKQNQQMEPKIQEWTSSELTAEQAKNRKRIARERKQNAIETGFAIGSGRLKNISWPNVKDAFVNYGYLNRRIFEYETEKQLRVAQSFGSLLFVILGAPVGILFAKRDFLSAFISCFLPIILLYYPLMLLGRNLGNENVLDPVYALWGGNILLGVLAGFVLPPVIKH